jgi:hypothetical protein
MSHAIYTNTHSHTLTLCVNVRHQLLSTVAGLPLEQHDPGIGGRRGSSSGGLTVASGSATVGTSSNSNANNSSSGSNLVLTAALQEEEKCSLRGLVWKV